MLNRWTVCLLALFVSLGLSVNAEEKKEPKKEEKKAEKKEEKKKEEKKDEKKPVVLNDAVKKAWDSRYKGAEVIEIKDKQDSFEIKAKDALNSEFKVVYGADGKLWSESKRVVPTSSVVVNVIDTAKKWAPAAKWNENAEVSTKKGEMPVYEISGTMLDKKIKAEISEDGKVVKADKLPEAKKEEPKKEEKKSEKKEEKKKEAAK
ncbi:MAG TPA: hypothetical protein VEK08_01985 [Planctomycetota bacterium]|nr:hypothetical protein [Planctomycetota bacterium]